MILDQGTEFTGADFQAGLERHCIQPLFIDQDAPFENGVTESRGWLVHENLLPVSEVGAATDHG